MPEVKQTNSGKLGVHQSLRTRRAIQLELVLGVESIVELVDGVALWQVVGGVVDECGALAE